MDFLQYFKGLEAKKFKLDNSKEGQLVHDIHIHWYGEKFDFPSDVEMVILGVCEERASTRNGGCSLAPDEVRKYLYSLYSGPYNCKIADLGNIPAGNQISDTYFALKETLKALMKKNIFPIIIGGSKDLAYYNYLAYEELEQTVNLVSIEPSFAIGDNEKELSDENYLSKIILHQPNFLFNYSNIGYQSYYTNPKEVDLLDELYFDSYRLGFLKKDIKETEPIIRNADLLCFDMGSIKQTDAPANLQPSPNGLLGDEACQLSRYAGMSDKLSSIGFYEMNPTVEDNGQTASLLSQMIWYFIDGFYNRKKDFPACNKTEYKKYTVASEKGEETISFYKSGKSDRWWMDVPYDSGQSNKYTRHLMVPCSYKDYETAMNYEIPERWFQTFKKLKDG